MNMRESFGLVTGNTFVENAVSALQKIVSRLTQGYSSEIQETGQDAAKSYITPKARDEFLKSPDKAVAPTANLTGAKAQVVFDSANWTGGPSFNEFTKPKVEVSANFATDDKKNDGNRAPQRILAPSMGI